MQSSRKILLIGIFGFTIIFFMNSQMKILSANAKKRSEKIISQMERNKKEMERLRWKNKDLEIENKILQDAVIKKISSNSETKLFMEKFLDNRDDGIPLSGGLRDPQPMIKVGHIEKGADIIFGIPTVKREKASYLKQMLTSMFVNLNKNSKYKVKFVVFVAETDRRTLNETIIEITNQFPAQIQNNMLQVISPSYNLYPDWTRVIRMPDHFGDPYDRVLWRSKQNLDFVYLLMYSYNLHPKYYVMMEDDAITQMNYVEDIMKFAKEKESTDYFVLSFCQAGFIGKLFRREVLASFASYIHLFYLKKPADWLQYEFSASDLCSYDEPCQKCRDRVRERIIDRKPSLFQHMGTISSLKGKQQKFKDRSFVMKN